MKNKVTIKDIANKTGVSIATVSNVINGNHHKTSEKTINKINKAIQELNYIPNYSARSLVKQQSKMIGVVIPQTEEKNQVILENPFYSELISGIESKLREKGYYMLLTGVDVHKNYLDVFVNWNLDGAIILGIYQEAFYEQLKQINVPIVLVDSYMNDDYFSHVGIDDVLGGYLATHFLIEAGHKRIAHVTGNVRKEGVVEKRLIGYKKALEEAGIEYDPSLVYAGYIDYEYGIEAGMKIGQEKKDVTAVFAIADVLAAGVICGFHEKGLSVPEDISVIGFDNIPISKMIVPALTTIDQDIYEKGIKSIELLLERVEGKDTKKKEIKEVLMPLRIIERKSVRKKGNKDG